MLLSKESSHRSKTSEYSTRDSQSFEEIIIDSCYGAKRRFHEWRGFIREFMELLHEWD